jgi:hypothetical protein
VTQQNDTLQLLREALHTHVVQVNFIKADGSMRVMQATLRESDLPPPTNSTPRVTSSQVCRVWDLDKQAWRSFRTDQVQSWHMLHQESGA